MLKKGQIERRAVGPRDVEFRITHCGVCHSDLHEVRSEWDNDSYYPMCPGHEMVGVVTKVGAEVTRFRVGEHVGSGVFAYSCGECDECRAGLDQYCTGKGGGKKDTTHGAYNCFLRDAESISVHNFTLPDGTEGEVTHGGYSGAKVVHEDYVLRIPEKIPLEKAGPLLCAGITTYSPLVHFGARAGGRGFRVGVVGFGGLGHMAVKFALSFGNPVTVLSTSESKRAKVEAMGCTFVASKDIAQMKANKRSIDLIINTASANHDVTYYFPLLKTQGTMCLVGLPPKPLEIKPFKIIGRRMKFAGSGIGSIGETQEMLQWAADHDVIPSVKIIPASAINHAMADLAENAAPENRYVIDIAGTLASTTDVEGDERIDISKWATQGTVLPPDADLHKAERRRKALVAHCAVGAAVVGVAAVAFALLSRRS